MRCHAGIGASGGGVCPSRQSKRNADSAESARALESLVFGVQVRDPATYAGLAALLLLVALAAAFVPARRAVRVDPVTALRHD